jgi:prepilin-type processing-associated H-X9-DG protein
MKNLFPSLLALIAAGGFAPLAEAHVSVGGDRTLNSGNPIDGQTVTNSVRTVSSSFGWADGADANFGDSHRITAFRFTLSGTQTVTITVEERNAVGQTGAFGTFLPAFSLYTTPEFVPSTHDFAIPTVAYLAATYGNAAPSDSFTDTDGDTVWDAGEPFLDADGNGVYDLNLGGSGKEGAFNALDDWTILSDASVSMTFHYVAGGNRADGTAANYGSAVGIQGDGLADGSVTGSFVLGPGTYYLFVGGATLGNQGADYTGPASTRFNSYGIGLTVQAVPEPGSGLLAVVGGVVLALRRRRSKERQSGAAGITVIELLVALAISAVLVVMGLSAASGARTQADATKCLSNLRQFGTAVHLYGGDNGGRLPDTSHVRQDGVSQSWTNTLAGYLAPDFIGRCPARKTASAKVTYAWNDFLADSSGLGVAVPLCRAASKTLAIAETAEGYTSEHFHFRGARSGVTYNQFRRDVFVQSHSSHANYLFVDGHVEKLTPNEIRFRLAAADKIFIEP